MTCFSSGSEEAAYRELLPQVEELLQTIPKRPELWQSELDALGTERGRRTETGGRERERERERKRERE